MNLRDNDGCDHIGAGEFKCVFMMEEIVAIRDIKYCPFLHKIFFYQFSSLSLQCLTINVLLMCTRELKCSYRLDAIQSASPDTSIPVCHCGEKNKKTPIDYISRRINLCNV